MRERLHAAVRAGTEQEGFAHGGQGRGAQVAEDEDRDGKARESVDVAGVF